MIKITASKGDKEMRQVLMQLGALSNGFVFTSVFKDIGEYLKLSTRLRFDKAESPDGQPWKANSPNTRKYGINKPLHGKTLNLRDGFVWQATAKRLMFGPGQPTTAYARIQQFGGEAGRGHKVILPARTYLGVSDTDRRIILKKLTQALERAMTA